MTGRRQMLTRRSVYGGAILLAMAAAVLALLAGARDRLGSFRGEHEWQRYSDQRGAFSLEVPATWHQRELGRGAAETRTLFIRSSDTVIGIVGSSFGGRLPQRAPAEFWQGLARQTHEEVTLRLWFDRSLTDIRENGSASRTGPGALYWETEVTCHEDKVFQDIAKWGRRVTMVTRSQVCIVECLTRATRREQMEPVFRHVLGSLKPGTSRS